MRHDSEVRRQKSKIRLRAIRILCSVLFVLFSTKLTFSLTNEEILKYQSELKDKPVGERIAFWAEKFVGAPYDKDPIGEYVSRAVIVADDRVDCMYLTFRAVELAMSNTPEEAVQIALDKRFHSNGVLKNGKVINYDDRFKYGEDMIYSGKWGKEITSEIGKTIKTVASSKGQMGTEMARQKAEGRLSLTSAKMVDMLPPEELMKGIQNLKSGDIIFFIKAPEKRITGELVGHIGIIKTEEKSQKSEVRKDTKVYLIHAGGIKGKGGRVKKVLLKDYIRKMPFTFIGAKITRFY